MGLETSLRQPLRVVGVFAGVGGLELGLSRAGFRADLLCELLPTARSVLAEHFGAGGTRIVADARSDLEPALPDRFEVLTAGFPCQDLSQAGRTRGIGGERSGLVELLFDLIQKRPVPERPAWVILENVANMRHLQRGRAMDVVLGKLTKLGYDWAYRELDSRAFGVAQRRRRLFIVACCPEAGDPRSVLFRGDVVAPRPAFRPLWQEGVACAFSWTEGNRGVGWAEDCTPTLKGGSGLGIPSPPALILPSGFENAGSPRLVTPTIQEAERLQGLPADWTRSAESLPRGSRARWLHVGNGVSVPVAKWIGQGILESSSRAWQPINPQPIAAGRWPVAGWQTLDSERFGEPLGRWPVDHRTALLDSLEPGVAERRPLLSRRATAGFLKRFEASRLLSPNPGLREALLELLRDRCGVASAL